MEPLKILSNLGGFLGGAAEAVNTLLDIKRNSVAPAVEAVGKAGETIMKSPIVKTLGETGESIVEDLQKNGNDKNRNCVPFMKNS